MKEKISSRLRLLLCFGVIAFISLASPLTAEAHSADMGAHEEGVVYEGINPWDGLFTIRRWEIKPKVIGTQKGTM